MQIIILARSACEREVRLGRSSFKPNKAAERFHNVMHECRRVSHEVRKYMVGLTNILVETLMAYDSHLLSLGPHMPASPTARIDVAQSADKPAEQRQNLETPSKLEASSHWQEDNFSTGNSSNLSVTAQSSLQNQSMPVSAASMGRASSLASVQSLSALASMSSLPYSSATMVTQQGKSTSVRPPTMVQLLPGIVEVQRQTVSCSSSEAAEVCTDSTCDKLSNGTVDEEQSTPMPASVEDSGGVSVELMPSLGLQVAASLIYQVEASDQATVGGEAIGEGYKLEYETSGARWLPANLTERGKKGPRTVKSVYRKEHASSKLHTRRATQLHPIGKPAGRSAATGDSQDTVKQNPGTIQPQEVEATQEYVQAQPVQPWAAYSQMQQHVADLASQLSLPTPSVQPVAQQPGPGLDVMWQYNVIAHASDPTTQEDNTDRSSLELTPLPPVSHVERSHESMLDMTDVAHDVQRHALVDTATVLNDSYVDHLHNNLEKCEMEDLC